MNDFVGAIIFTMAMVYPAPPISCGGFSDCSGHHYLPADGRCIDIIRYPALAKVMHSGENWPYGRCDGNGFRLPDMRSLQPSAGIPLIRVE